eukprot:403363882
MTRIPEKSKGSELITVPSFQFSEISSTQNSLPKSNLYQGKQISLHPKQKTDGRTSSIYNSLITKSILLKQNPLVGQMNSPKYQRGINDQKFEDQHPSKQSSGLTFAKTRLPVFKEFQNFGQAQITQADLYQTKDYAAVSTKDDDSSDGDFDNQTSSPRKHQESNFEEIKQPTKLQHSSSEKYMKTKLALKPSSKILKIYNVTDLVILKAELEKLGNIIFQDSHYLNKNDYIVKYEKLDEAERAYEILSLKYTIEYITTQHSSDEATYYLSKLRGNFDQQEQDACLTLNMLKLKNNSYQQINDLSSQTYRGYSQSFTFPQSYQNELEVFNNQIENNSMSRNEGLSINSNCYVPTRNIPQTNLSKGISVEEAVQRISLQNDSQDTVQDNQYQTIQQQDRNYKNQAEQIQTQVDFIKADQSLQTKQIQSINFDQAYNSSAESSYNHNSGFKINLNNILNFKDQRTTIMIKNIPNKYTQKMLLSKINENHRDKYDFFYLPIDFKNKCNVGYAFINFVDSIFILKFFEELNGKRWECFNSEKVCEITYGRIQGKHQLIEHFDTSNLWFSSDRKVKPLILNVVQPNASFVKDYRKNLMVQFGSQSEIQTMKFQQKNGDHSNSRQYESQGQQNNSRQVTYYNRNY